MTTDLVAQHDYERAFDLAPQMSEMARMLAASPFVPDTLRGDAGAVFSIIVAGHGLGMSPVAALQSFDIIKGKPYLKTEVMLGMFYRAGHSVAWGVCNDRTATVRCTRGDGRGTAEITYTMAMAERAGLAGKDNWRKSPGEMLRARAVRGAMRMVGSDVFLGAMGDDDAPPDLQPAPAAVVQISSGPAAGLEPAQPPAQEAMAARTDPPPATEPIPAVELVTGPQMRKLGALIGEWEQLFNDGARLPREERRRFIGELAQRPDLATAKDLTVGEASLAIEVLQGMVAQLLEIVQGEIVEDPS
jgi:hypothetical protein